MPTTHAISPDDFRALLTRLRGHDFGGWSRSTLEGVAAAEGWTIGEGDYPKLATPAPLLGGRLIAGYRDFADFQELSLGLAEGATLDDFHRLVAVATEVIGHEPPIWGGPGPFVRWRQDGTSFEDPGLSTEIAFRKGRITLELHATQVTEYYWNKSVEWGDGIHDPGPSWMATANHPSLGGMTFPGGRVVYDWGLFEEALGNLIHTLAHDVPGMGDGMSLILAPRHDPARYVRFIIDEEADLIMEASAELDPADRPDDATMERLGWDDRVQREPHNWWAGYRAPDAEESAAAAKLLVATLRAYGAELLDEDWTNEKTALTYTPNYVGRRVRGWFDLWGLYLPR
ncbi:MAG TPA: hypothetical protein VHJ17_24450 [Thermomonospora sp.]|nr:hypothetical protein [Thermomonospora sp.]